MFGIVGFGRKDRSPEGIQRMKAMRDIKGLLHMASDKEVEVSLGCIKALGDLAESGELTTVADLKGYEVFPKLLGNQVPAVRAYALRAIYWLEVRGDVSEVYSSGMIKYIIPQLLDPDPHVRKYGLFCLFELVERGHAEAVIYTDGSRALGALILSSDAEERTLAINLVSELAQRGFGSEMIRSGIARALLFLTNRTDDAGRKAEEALLRVFSPLGMVDLAVIAKHLEETEHDAGSVEEVDAEVRTDMDAYYFGGATGAMQHPGFQSPPSHGQATVPAPEFVLDESELEVDASPDDDLEKLVYASEGRTMETETVLKRLRDLRMFLDQRLINPEDYAAMKGSLLGSFDASVKLESLNCYECLEVPFDATPDQIKEAYKRLATQYHPDKVDGMGAKLRELAREEMTKLNHARETLLDPQKRQAHDMMLSVRVGGPA